MSEMIRCNKPWILRYGELWSKEQNVRRQFQRALSNNMENLAINSRVSLIQGRIGSMEVVTSNSSSEDVENLLCHVLGVVAIDSAKVIANVIEPEQVAGLYLQMTNFEGKKEHLESERKGSVLRTFIAHRNIVVKSVVACVSWTIAYPLI